MTRVNDKYRKTPRRHWEEVDINQWIAEREAVLAERKRRNDEEIELRRRRAREKYEQERLIREVERYERRQKKKAAERYRQLVGAVCGLELSEDAMDLRYPQFIDYPYLLDNVHTTEDYAIRWLHDTGIDVSH